MSVHGRPHPRVERHTSKIVKPGYPYSFEVTVEGSRKTFARFVNRKGCACIGTCNGAQCECKVRHRAAQTPGCAQCRPGKGCFWIGYAAYGRTETRDIAK